MASRANVAVGNANNKSIYFFGKKTIVNQIKYVKALGTFFFWVNKWKNKFVKN